jgi:hypothetical protein
MKITESTTLSEIAFERARLGISRLSLSSTARGTVLAAATDAHRRKFFGNGATVAQAIDDLFGKVARSIATTILVTPKVTP